MASTPLFPVEKYSYTTPTASATAGEIRWNHLGEHGLAIAVETDFSGPSSPVKCIKVVGERNVLEHIQLEMLCRKSQVAIRQGLTEFPINAVTRSPRLALTYQDESGLYRRFQIRFRHSSDYDAIVKILADFKCPTRTTQDRPQIALKSAIPNGATAASAEELTAWPDTANPQGYGEQHPGRPGPYRSVSAFGMLHGHHSHLDSSKTTFGSQLAMSQPSEVSVDQSSDSRPPSSLELPPLQKPTFTDRQTHSTVVCANGSLQIHTPMQPQILAEPDHPQPNRPPLTPLQAPPNLSAHRLQPDITGSDLCKQLREYAAQPSSMRQQIIDDMICEYLLDDGFKQICEDVELSWRRIGFE